MKAGEETGSQTRQLQPPTIPSTTRRQSKRAKQDRKKQIESEFEKLGNEATEFREEVEIKDDTMPEIKTKLEGT